MKLTALCLFALWSISSFGAEKVTVTIYGKGATTVETEPDGSTKTIFCPEEARLICAMIKIPLAFSGPIVFTGLPVEVRTPTGTFSGTISRSPIIRIHKGRPAISGRSFEIIQ